MALVLAAAGVLLAVVALQPSTTHIERAHVLPQAPSVVFPLVDDMAAFAEWNPWRDLEPDATVKVSPESRGVGAWYAWQGEQVGRGRMVVTSTRPGVQVDARLEFIEPFESEAHVTFTLEPTHDQGTRVVWGYDSVNSLTAKAAGLMVDVDAMLGADFERGLDKLAAMAAERDDGRARAEAEAAAAEAARIRAEEAATAERAP
ncbi:MAG: SRPBCC family protein [Alphaproteobacteria bacterium]|nr:SRPBCC family protein [Alphaproteobacteria bacterium]MCB9699560.1 SRPBCC family protein [Alphaproteobacteria bacterium]